MTYRGRQGSGPEKAPRGSKIRQVTLGSDPRQRRNAEVATFEERLQAIVDQIAGAAVQFTG